MQPKYQILPVFVSFTLEGLHHQSLFSILGGILLQFVSWDYKSNCHKGLLGSGVVVVVGQVALLVNWANVHRQPLISQLCSIEDVFFRIYILPYITLDFIWMIRKRAIVEYSNKCIKCPNYIHILGYFRINDFQLNIHIQ